MDATPRTTGAPQADTATEDTSSKDGVLIRTLFPVDHFDHGVKGVAPVTLDGIRVAKAKVKALQEAAAQAYTTLIVED